MLNALMKFHLNELVFLFHSLSVLRTLINYALYQELTKRQPYVTQAVVTLTHCRLQDFKLLEKVFRQFSIHRRNWLFLWKWLQLLSFVLNVFKTVKETSGVMFSMN